MKPLTQRPGSALVITLLVITVLSIVVVAFLASMSIERLTANGYARKLSADLLADAGFEWALNTLGKTTLSGPYATTFQLVGDTPYPFYLKRDLTANSTTFHRFPLYSSQYTAPGYFDTLAAALIDPGPISVPDLDSSGATVTRQIPAGRDTQCNINGNYGLNRPSLIGLRKAGAVIPVPVNWIYQRNESGRVIGRYAYWVDDESSKFDLRFAGNEAGPGSTHERAYGKNLNEIALKPFTLLGLNSEQVSNLIDFKNQTTPVSAITNVRYPVGPPGKDPITDADQWARVRPYLTTSSLSDERSPDGKQKINLNDLVKSTTNLTEIGQQTTAIQKAISENLPAFGQRYFSTRAGVNAIPSAAEQAIYVRKIAANIRDFIDSDSTATLMKQDGTPIPAIAPNFIPYELIEDEIPIVGKERGPFLSEYMRVARVISPHFASGTGSVTFRFAHYIELHNPTGKAISYSDLGTEPYLYLVNREKWQQTGAGSPSVLRPVNIKIRLPAAFSIPPGGYAVITTDGPPFADSQLDYHGPAERYLITKGTGPGTWETIDGGGQTIPTGAAYEDYTITTEATTSNRYGLQVGDYSATSPYADNRERLIFGNTEGLIDYALRIYTIGAINLGRDVRNPCYATTFPADPITESKNTANSLTTEPRFSRGDVRSNTEVVRLGNNAGSCWKAGGTAYGDKFGVLPTHQPTLGSENYNYSQALTGVALWRGGWKEYTTNPAGNHFVANRPLRSIGELGAIYDPARYDIDGYLSHGATLRFGQADDPSNNRNLNSTVAGYQNWLGGVGSRTMTNANFPKNAFLLADVFRTSNFEEGKLNPNGMARDPEDLVLRSLIEGFTFSSDPTEQASAALAGKSVNATDFFAYTRDEFKAGVGFTSAGELSSLAIFHSKPNSATLGRAAELVSGQNMALVSDAGKEELLRRTLGLLTTHSLAFTVYSVGQAGTFTGSASASQFRVFATSTRETTVQIKPEYATSTPDQPLPPARWSAEVRRNLRQ